jgi:molecular chaperone GrpE
MVEDDLNVESENSAPPDAGPDEALSEQGALDIESTAFAELPLSEQVDLLKGALQDASHQVAQNVDLAQRAQADMANFRRRTDEERIAQGKYSASRVIAKLLPVVEELDLAMNHADSNDSDDLGEKTSRRDAQTSESAWFQGVRLIQRKLLALLESEGVTAIDSVGVAFNPLEHEALGTDESTEFPPGHVIQAVRKGYRLHDRIIQPAQVIVATEPR